MPARGYFRTTEVIDLPFLNKKNRSVIRSHGAVFFISILTYL